MMRSERFERVAAVAKQIGARLNRAGDGAFILLHRGQQTRLHNLWKVSQLLVKVAPFHQDLVEDAARRNRRIQRDALGCGRKKPAEGLRHA